MRAWDAPYAELDRLVGSTPGLDQLKDLVAVAEDGGDGSQGSRITSGDAGEASIARLTLVFGGNQGGRSTLLSFLAAAFMRSPAQYQDRVLQLYTDSSQDSSGSKLNSDICSAVPSLEALEAIQALRVLNNADSAASASTTASTSSAATDATHIPMSVDGIRPEDLRAMQSRMRAFFGKPKKYKIKNPSFNMPEGLLPTGDQSQACTQVAVVLSYAETPQLLVRVKSAEDVRSMLKLYLQVQAYRGSDDAVSISPDDEKYLHNCWSNLILPDIDMQKEVKAFKAAPRDYNPPMRLWVHTVLGRDYVHTGRTATLKPNLYMELVHVVDVLRLHVHPGSLREMYNWRPQQLLSYLATIDVSGPWSELAKSKEELDGLKLVLSHVQLFLPCDLLDLLGVQPVDAPGCDDADSVRSAALRDMEERVSQLLVVTPKDLQSTRALTTHLTSSPVLRDWAAGLVNNGATSKKFFSLCWYMERDGLRPPHRTYGDNDNDDDEDDEDDDVGSSIGCKYLLKHGQHYGKKAKEVVQAMTAQLSQLLEDFNRQQGIGLSCSDIKHLASCASVFNSLPMLGTAIELASSVDDLPKELTCSAKEVEAILRLTRHKHFMAALMLPQYEDFASAVHAAMRCLQGLDSRLEQLTQEPHPSAFLDKLSDMDREWAKQHVQQFGPPRAGQLELHVGTGSVVAAEFNNKFRDVRANTLLAMLDTTFASADLQDAMADALTGNKGVVQRLSNSYLSPRRPQVQQLLHLLAPAYNWQHRDAPLRMLLTRACYSILPVDGVAALVAQVQQEARTASRQVIEQLLTRYIRDRPNSGPDQATISGSGLDLLVHRVLDDPKVCFDSRVSSTFKVCFFAKVKPGNERNFLERLMRKLVREKLSEESFRLDVHRRLVAASQQPDPVQSVQSALSTSVSAVMRIVLRHVKTKLQDYLCGSLDLLRGRLYEAHRQHPSAASFRNSVLIPVYKLSGSTVRKLLQPGGAADVNSSSSPTQQPAAAAAATAGAGAELVRIQQARKEVRQQLLEVTRLLDPSHLAKVLLEKSPCSDSSPLAKMLAPTMQLTQQMLLQQNGQGSTLLPQDMRQAIAAEAQPQALHMTSSSGAQSSNWLVASLSVTSEQMAALQAHLAQHNLQFKEAGAEGNNCFALAVLSQLLGDAAAGDAAHHMRQLSANYLQQQLADEGADGPLTAAIRVYAGLSDQCTSQQLQTAINSHLTGLQGATMFTDIDMAAMAAVVQQVFNASIIMYNPTYSGFSRCYTDAAGAVQTVRVAYVCGDWLTAHLAGQDVPRGSGPLNHFVAVVDDADQVGESTAGGKRRHEADGNNQSGPKRQQTAGS